MEVFGRKVIGGATLLWGRGAWVNANPNNGKMEGKIIESCKGLYKLETWYCGC